MNEDQWIEECKPIPNPFRKGTGFDYGEGSCLLTQTDLQQYKAAHSPSEDVLWTVIEDDDSEHLYIAQGIHWINALGFLVTQQPPRFTLTEDIRVE